MRRGGSPKAAASTSAPEDVRSMFDSLLTPEQRAKLNAASGKEEDGIPRRLKYSPKPTVGTAVCALLVVFGAVWTTVLYIKVGPICAKRVAQLHPQIASIARYLSRRPNPAVAEVGKWVQRARVWPLLNAAAFALNVVAVSLPGRIDGKYAETKGMPRDDEYRGLVTPAGWAFALWGLIYTSEAASVVYQGWVADKAPAWMAAASPGWIAANLFQALWCAAFRPWARPLASFWLTPLLLSSVAVSLSFSQGVMAAARGGMTATQWFLMSMPVSVHCGWTAAAALVNANSVVALAAREGRVGLPTQAALAGASLWAATGLAVVAAAARGDFMFALTAAWALTAIRADGAKATERTPDRATVMSVLTSSAGIGAGVCAAAAAVAMVAPWLLKAKA